MVAARKLPEPVLLSLEKIRLDGGTQSRAELNADRVSAYLENVTDLPPIEVYFDGESYWLTDGFHRHEAYRRAERKRAACIVRQGTREDATWASLAANKEHDAAGLARSNADKRRAVEMALRHPKGADMSSRALAEHVGVSNPFVLTVRAQVLTVSTSGAATVTGKDGKSYKATKPKAQPKPTPGATPASDAKSEPPKSGPHTAPPPAPEKWECQDCHTWWPDDVTECSECVTSEPVAAFDASEAIELADQAFEEMMLTWPRTESLAPVVDWLKTKLGMTEQEAARWPTK